MKKLYAFVLALFCAANFAHGQATTFVNVGNQIYIIPVPKGYLDGRVNAPELNELFEKMTASGAAKLKTSLFAASDVAKFYKSGDGDIDAYYGVMTPRDETKLTSQLEFDQMRISLNKLQKDWNAKVSPHVNKHFDKLNKPGAIIDGTKFEIQVGEMIPLGVFEDTPKSFAYAFMTTVTDKADPASTNDMMVSVVGFLYMKERIVMLPFYKKLKTSDDVTKSKNHVIALMRATERANP